MRVLKEMKCEDQPSCDHAVENYTGKAWSEQIVQLWIDAYNYVNCYEWDPAYRLYFHTYINVAP